MGNRFNEKDMSNSKTWDVFVVLYAQKRELYYKFSLYQAYTHLVLSFIFIN